MARPTKHQARYKNVGRPSKMTDEVVGKLKQAAALDASVEEMCFYAGIHKDTYYEWMRKNPQLSDEIEALRNKPILKARETVIGGLDKDPHFALSYLERKRKNEFSTKSITEHQGQVAIGGPITEEQRKIAEKYEEELRDSFIAGPKTPPPLQAQTPVAAPATAATVVEVIPTKNI